MIVKARCAYRCWVNLTLVNPGEVCEIEHDGPLATMRKGSSWVFEFDRTMAGTGEAPALGGFICKDCGKSFDAVQQLGNHTKHDHQKTGWNPPKMEAHEEVEEADPAPKPPRKPRSPGTYKCKVPGCGQQFDSLPKVLAHRRSDHKPESQSSTQATPA